MEQQEVLITLDNFTLRVSGVYDIGEEPVYHPVDEATPGIAPSFKVNGIDIVGGTALNFIEWFCDHILGRVTKAEIENGTGRTAYSKFYTYLEDLCIKKLS